MKKILIAAGVVALSAGIYLELRNLGFLPSQKSVPDLIAHFRSDGLSVTVDQPSPGEQSAINEFNAILKKWPGSTGDKTYDGGDLTVGSAHIKVTFFRDTESAKKYYDYFSKLEKVREQMIREGAAENLKGEYLINGRYVMKIYHYDVSIRNGKFDVKILELDPKEVEAVKNSFARFR